MERRLVFIPIAAEELAAITGDVQLVNREAYTVTPELLSAQELRTDQVEEAEFAALVLASVTSLSRFGQRLVLVAEVPPADVVPGPDAANGGCTVASVSQNSLTCWFSDAPGLDVTAAAASARGLDLDTAWERPQVQELIQHDLLWNDVQEFKRQRTRRS